MKKKVFVSGCFDMLHSGHIAFFKEASEYGDLYVGIGSDSTISELKGRLTINSEQERIYMINAIKYVKNAFVNSGSGILDFKEDLIKLKPDYFVVNEDGFSPKKEELCQELNIELKKLKRIPDSGLPERSTTAIRTGGNCTLPYRIDLGGTWIDQPYVSKYHPGWAITVSLEPIVEYNERCGMSTSTRNAAKKIWPYYLPLEKPEKLAEILFKFENTPGSTMISGAQDAVGICMPGLTRHYYSDGYWPTKLESEQDESILTWLEEHISMVLLWPREAGLDLLGETYINEENVKSLASAADDVWSAIQDKNLKSFADAFLNSFNAQVKMFPAMVNDRILKEIDKYKDQAMAWKLAGAGGAGYLIMVSEKPIEGSMRIKIRRSEIL
ncbi:adenylyltransferase/cytidyltransferase family protein [Polaribacter vadi]|uniref:adenylyltransferase/cytidyltransferase family protein n=1 Tax=Polaribacter TaxID=52959 RepID=UPI001C08365B|nr:MULTISPECIES: adenylyltransferase/cytidyltransferase family protein [Polaribacter]MBU3010997.1 adenylyltransferase/cytidyltransferase family protein [Polaribacter vadi]MDO6740810.1 adenylyltransferase/cytidyltransferase family protein [Polaribacter sp. 1_MG-2023]